MKPYSNSRRNHFGCDYGCCRFRKHAGKLKCLKHAARQKSKKEIEDIEMFNETPRYIHDCDKAIFLGWFLEYDLYFCNHWSSKIMHTVVARYGNNPPDYMSGMPTTKILSAPLDEAFKRAVGLGYANPDDYK